MEDLFHTHSIRVGILAQKIALALGWNEVKAMEVGAAACFHDVGKAALSRNLLLKPGELTEEEITTLRHHAVHSFVMLRHVRGELGELAANIALSHHERLDGSGYLGESGERQDMYTRIVAAADVYDALTSDRPYRTAWSREQALDYLRKHSGSMFDWDVVSALISLV